MFKSSHLIMAVRSHNSRREAAIMGFSLLELLITLTIIIIILLLAVSGLLHFSQRNKTTIVVDQLVSAINYARSQAIMQGVIVTLCGSSDHQQCDGQWRQGQIVKVDSAVHVLRVYPALSVGDNLFWQSSLGKNDYLKFAPTGFTNGQDGSFYYCPKYSSNRYGAIIVVSLSGRVRVSYDAQTLQQTCG